MVIWKYSGTLIFEVKDPEVFPKPTTPPTAVRAVLSTPPTVENPPNPLLPQTIDAKLVEARMFFEIADPSARLQPSLIGVAFECFGLLSICLPALNACWRAYRCHIIYLVFFLTTTSTTGYYLLELIILIFFFLVLWNFFLEIEIDLVLLKKILIIQLLLLF